VKLIPEKTVEQWMAVSLVDFFGPDTWLWSDSAGWDQHAWIGAADVLSKWVLFELKAPEDNRAILVDTDQLTKYVGGFHNGEHPDVLYVLPDPPWGTAPQSAQQSNPRAAPRNRRTFASWSFCVPASTLLALIQQGNTGGSLPASAAIRCHSGVVWYPRLRSWVAAPTLGLWLGWLAGCTEPPGTAWRSPDLVGPEFAEQYEAWILSPERLEQAARYFAEVDLEDDVPARTLVAFGF
jgi:hypothetical protein